MLFLRLFLLTLLIAAQSVLISAENVINCYGHVQRLTCGTGNIHVQSAIYGRTDVTTCSAGYNSNQVQNTQCSMNVPQIAKRCDGQRVCEYQTDALGLADPCYGTYKYFNITYSCNPGIHVSVMCEGGYGSLDCGKNVIKIINANYGRTDTTTCSVGRPSSQITNTHCYAPDTLSSVVTRCNGRSSCSLWGSHTIFTDPCVGTYKYLRVSYYCVRSLPRTSVTCDGSTTVLTCDSGVLKIQSASYGRTDSTTCSAGRPASEIRKTDCYTPGALSEVKKRCQAKTTCSFALNIFKDPCVNTYKYLKVTYTCEV